MIEIEPIGVKFCEAENTVSVIQCSSNNLNRVLQWRPPQWFTFEWTKT